MAMTRNQKLVVGGVAAGAVVLAIVLMVRKAKADTFTPAPEEQVPGEGSGVFIPLPGGYQVDPSLISAIPDLTPTNQLPTGVTSSAESGPNDPLKLQGWNWGYLGGVDPAGFYGMGTQVAPSSLPFSEAAVKAITPITSIKAAYYLGPGEALVQGYYIMGPLKTGFSFEAGDWGLVEVWDPDWHGY
jgi:hypothetical protein